MIINGRETSDGGQGKWKFWRTKARAVERWSQGELCVQTRNDLVEEGDGRGGWAREERREEGKQTRYDWIHEK